MRTLLAYLLLLLIGFTGLQYLGQVELKGADIITRKQWIAQPLRTAQMDRHIPGLSTVHYTGTSKNPDKTIEEKLQTVQRFSYSEGVFGNGRTPKKPRGDVPYHSYIAEDGSIAQGRKIHFKGDSNTDYDLQEYGRVKIGAELLFTPEHRQLIQGKRVGLVTNHRGILPDGEHLIDLFHRHPEVELSVLFGPEHGLRGEEDAHVSDGTDPKTGLPVISLYGTIRKPTPQMLANTDVLVFDIQDIGARFYTYIKTMLNVLEAAAESGIPFVVLDRPNPITGTYVDGPVGKALDAERDIGKIPITHGMTVGELALMFNAERAEKQLVTADLTVIPLQNYQRSQWYDETGLPWIKPSPNMLRLQTAIVYPATCLLEGTNYSEARGTEYPFERFGAPWTDPSVLNRQLNGYKLKGVHFRPIAFIPDSLVDGVRIYPPKFLGEQVRGIEMLITDRNAFRSAAVGVYILHALKTTSPQRFEWRTGRIDGLLGSSEIREQLDSGKSPQEIVGLWDRDLEEFRKKRENYLLY